MQDADQVIKQTNLTVQIPKSDDASFEPNQP